MYHAIGILRGELICQILQGSDGGVREAVLMALKGVIKHTGKSVSSGVRYRGFILLKDLLQVDDDEVRSSAAKVIGTLSQVRLIQLNFCETSSVFA